MKKIVILTSGGDAPGMNAAIRAVVRTACYKGLKIYGCKSGYQGLVNKELIPLEANTVANCIQYGGTILKAERCLAFREKSTRDNCRAFLAKENIDGLIVIGGNGTFHGAALLAEEGGPPIIGIPGTIDNDIYNTEYTIGFDTARNTALQAIDKIRDTASSHNRNFLVEVMGRKSGFLAVDVGIAGGAEIILIPEFDLPIETIANKMLVQKRPKQNSIIVVAEANSPGRSIKLAEQLEALTKVAYRVCILGHTQRGGTPTTADRLIASQMGYLAVTSLLSGESHKMTAVHDGKLKLMPLPDTKHSIRQFTNQELLELNDVLCM